MGKTTKGNSTALWDNRYTFSLPKIDISFTATQKG